MSSPKTSLSPLAAALTGLRQVAARPHLLALMVGINLISAWILAAPYGGVLSATLDRNLHGEEMATGASWRWYDTVQRTRPEALGDHGAFTALLSPEGVSLSDLARLSGPPRAIALAALFGLWLNSLLACGFLATLYPDRRGGFGAAAFRLAAPATALVAFALVSYGGIYFLCYVQAGRWLEGAASATDREAVALTLTWGRLGLTLALLAIVKLLFDLSKVALVDRNSWNWPWACVLAAREAVLRGWRYLALYLLLPLAGFALLALLWSVTGGLIVAGGWLGLLVLFVLQQLFLTVRIALRLAQLAAVRVIYANARKLQARKAPFKVPAPERE